MEASVVALLHDDKFDEAIITCNVRPELQFHKAYALYKKERLGEALTIISSAEDKDTVRWRHLHGQILVRQGRYDEAATLYGLIYAGLPADTSPLDLADVRTNLVAALVSADAPSSALQHAALTPVLAAIEQGNVRRIAVWLALGAPQHQPFRPPPRPVVVSRRPP